MSGGAYNYAYSKLDNFIYEVNRREPSPERRAFLKHLIKVADAMKAIEWNDSGDGADEDTALKEVFNHGTLSQECHKLLVEDAKEIIEQLKKYTDEH